mmetsp:Transcript_76794/g.206972  ORF Transcript_76794/g.206972 Transcript_76794/m.206972 type:complete len:268 (+) Transcript_76794:3126-3929(+)
MVGALADSTLGGSEAVRTLLGSTWLQRIRDHRRVQVLGLERDDSADSESGEDEQAAPAGAGGGAASDAVNVGAAASTTAAMTAAANSSGSGAASKDAVRPGKAPRRLLRDQAPAPVASGVLAASSGDKRTNSLGTPEAGTRLPQLGAVFRSPKPASPSTGTVSAAPGGSAGALREASPSCRTPSVTSSTSTLLTSVAAGCSDASAPSSRRQTPEVPGAARSRNDAVLARLGSSGEPVGGVLISTPVGGSAAATRSSKPDGLWRRRFA